MAIIVDSDEVELHRMGSAFRQADFDVAEAKTAIEGMVKVLERDPGLIVLAEDVPPFNAGDLLPVFRRLSYAPIIVVGGGGDPEEVDALDAGGDFYLRRPFRPVVLLARARLLLRRYRRPREGEVLSNSLGVSAQVLAG